MDADILRLILIILGGFLLLGIYLWERKRGTPPAKPQSQARTSRRVEPTLGKWDARSGALTDDDQEVELDLRTLGSLLDEERRASFADRHSRQPGGPGAGERSRRVSAEVPDEAAVSQQSDGSAIPKCILQVVVAAKEGYFEGPDILRAVSAVGLQAGDMQIYHRRLGREPRSPVLFSMASMVEPGTFPFQDMEEFATPGLILFAQLPGPQDGMEVFSEMLSVARHLAGQLAGELLDETHSVMTQQTIEHVRSRILEHRRKLQIARSKSR